MIHQRYFKPGQKILLKTLVQHQSARTDLLTATVEGGDNTTFFVTLPYSDDAADQYPFSDGMPFEVTSESMGLGVRVTAEFQKKLSGRRIALKINSDLQMFQRRNTTRVDCKVGIRFTRGHGALKALRKTWEKNIQLLHSADAPLIYDGFKPCSVNLSAEGIRFNLKPPANPAELCLILINLDDGKPPICTLAEIAWTRPEKEETIMVCGMRFINILEEDQQRLEKFVRAQTH